MRIVNFLLAALFLFFAFVQVNDDNAAIWIIIYGFISVLCVLAIFRFYPIKILLGSIFILAVYMAFLFPSVLDWLNEDDKSVFFDQMQTEKPYIETSREFFGLLLANLTLLFHYLSARRYRRKT